VAEEKRKIRRIKKVETVRQRAEKVANTEPKPRRLHATAHKVSQPIRAAGRLGRKEVNLPLPDNRVGNFLGRRARLMPKFFSEAWTEVTQVTWPTRKETWKLTLAVFTFAIAFGLIIALVDYGLDKLFRGLLLQ
jgi:preprotein translocase SecE subunit